MHKKGSGLCCECNVQLGHESMENVLSCVLLVERCKTWCIDARSVGNFAGHERCGVGVNLDAGCIKMTNVDLNALDVDVTLLEETGTQSSRGTAVIEFVHLRSFETKSCTSCMDLCARKVKGKFGGVSFWYAGPKMAEKCEVLVVLVAVSESDMSHDVFFPCYDEDTQACAFHQGCGTRLELESNGVFELPVLRPPIALPAVQLLESERPQCDFQDCHQR